VKLALPDGRRAANLRGMSRITRIWKRSLRPVLVSAIRGRLGCGMPTPDTATTAAELAADSGGDAPTGCRMIALGSSPRTTLPPHGISGDWAASERVRAVIDNDIARAAYDRLRAGIVTQPASDRFVAVLPNASVTHDSGIVVSASGTAAVEDISGFGFGGDTPTNPLRLPYLPRPRRVEGTVAVLTTGSHHNYYHWLTEALPRFDLYAASGLPIDRYYAPRRHAFHRDAVALLGITPDRILPAVRNAHVSVDRLVASRVHDGLSRAKVDALHHRLTAAVGAAPTTAPRIFIRRLGHGARRLVNEAAVLRALESLGFVPCRPETLSFADQIRLFSQAECVVGPHGAGLTNLLFCREGTKVVEIGTPYRLWPCFREIAHHRGLDYHLHLATPVRVRHFDPRIAVGDSDLQVDPRGLVAAVAEFLAAAAPRTARAA
jgi:capsular polysaccharide biosynthesis protein